MSFVIPEKTLKLTPYDPTEDKYAVKLDANESPFSLPVDILARAMERIGRANLNRYPDPAFRRLRTLAADLFGVGVENITAGNGSDELISVLLNAFCARGDRVMVLAPDFSMYAFYSEIYELIPVNAVKADGFSISADEVIRAVKKEQPNVLIFSNPCNPAGQGIAREELMNMIRALPDTLIVVDEAYMDFWDQSVLPEITAYENALVLRTMSKAYGLAGLRLGFAIGAPLIVSQIDKVRSPFNVNMLTQIAAEEALSDTAWARARISTILKNKHSLEEALKEMATAFSWVQIVPTHTNFCLLKCDKCDKIYNALLDRGICVRSFASKGFLRMTAGSEAENAALLAALKELLEELS